MESQQPQRPQLVIEPSNVFGQTFKLKFKCIWPLSPAKYRHIFLFGHVCTSVAQGTITKSA